MGKIKSKAIRRAARSLKSEDINFSDNFEKNGLTESKKIRNQVSGLLSKVRKREIEAENNSK